MPIGLGLASSHAPNMFLPPEQWPVRYRQLTARVPQPPEAEQETPEVLRQYAGRIQAAFAALERQVRDYGPDVLLMVSDDQGEVFDRQTCMPNLAMHLGTEAEGSMGFDFLGKDAPTQRVRLKGHPVLAKYVAQGLVNRGFDLTCVREMRALGKPERGLSHGFTRTAPKLMPDLQIPVILMFLNCYFPPLPTANRCLELGRTIRELLDERPEKVAIYGSGGLSHDPMGPRAGWIDRPLDQFFLDSLAAGTPERMAGLYSFDSDTIRGGTGEIRNWLVVAGAMGDRRATVVDYIPVHHAVTGLGFAYWS